MENNIVEVEEIEQSNTKKWLLRGGLMGILVLIAYASIELIGSCSFVQ